MILLFATPALVHKFLPKRIVGEHVKLCLASGEVSFNELWENGALHATPSASIHLSRVSAFVMNEGIVGCGVRTYLGIIIKREGGGVEEKMLLPFQSSDPRTEDLLLVLGGLKYGHRAYSERQNVN